MAELEFTPEASVPDWVGPEARLILQALQQIGATMVTQADLDALTTRIDTAVTDIRGDIQRFIDANPTLDTSILTDAVGRLEGLAAENPAPPGP